MKITHCKLSQNKLLKFFIAEIATARTVANLLKINPNPAILFYHKIRLVIGHYLSPEVDKSYLDGVGYDVEKLGLKRLFLDF